MACSSIAILHFDRYNPPAPRFGPGEPAFSYPIPDTVSLLLIARCSKEQYAANVVPNEKFLSE